jgi:hypothetical protein
MSLSARHMRSFRGIRQVMMTTLSLALVSACSDIVPTAPVSPIAAAQVSATALVRTSATMQPTALIGDSIVVLPTSTVLVIGRKSLSSRSRSRLGQTSSTWSVTNSAVANVTGAGENAVLRTTAIGNAVLSQPSSNAPHSVVRSVESSTISSVRIVGIPDTLVIGQRVKPRLLVSFSAGSPTTTSVAAWSSSESSIAGFDSTLTFVALAPGRSTVTAEAFGRSMQATAVVRGSAVASQLTSSVSTIVLGASSTLQSRFSDANGNAVPCREVTWAATPSTGVLQLSPNGTSATVIGVGLGTATVTVSCDRYITASAVQSVTAPAPPLESIALRIVRLDNNGADSVFVSSGLPVKPGLVYPNAVSGIRILVGGREVSTYLEPLKGRHPDGSVRSLLVQFAVPRSVVTAEVALSLSGRTVAARGRTAPVSEPTAIVAYSSNLDAVESRIVGVTTTVEQSAFLGGYFLLYDQKFETYDAYQNQRNDIPSLSNYYDRVQAEFAFFVRSGNPIYFKRAATLARKFRDDFLIPSYYAPGEWLTILDGLAVHYWMTGDEASRDVVLKVASRIDHSHGGVALANNIDHPFMDNRVQARVLGSKVLSIMLGATSLPPEGWAAGVPDVKAAAVIDLGRILSTQSADGAYRWRAICGQSSNFMTGLLNGALAQYHRQYIEDPRIPAAIAKSYTWLRSTQWIAAQKTFQYYSGACAPYGDTSPGWDLNGLFLDGLAFLYTATKDPAWRAFGDAVFHGGVTNTFMDGPKQFNQQYQDSFRWLGAR